MAWSSPKTWVTGYKVLASDMNTFVSDNDSALRTGGLAIASQSAGDVVYASSSTQLARLAADSGKFLKSGASSVSWESVSSVPTILSKTTTYAIVDGNGKDIVVKADTSGGAWTLTLLDASTAAAGAKVTVVKTTSDVYKLTIDGASAETINGATTQTLSWLDQSMSLVCDGSNWIITHQTPNEIILPCTMLGLDNTTSEISMFTFEVKANQMRPGDQIVVNTSFRGRQYSGGDVDWSWDLSWGGNEFDLFTLTDASDSGSPYQGMVELSLSRTTQTAPSPYGQLMVFYGTGGSGGPGSWAYDVNWTRGENVVTNNSCDFGADATVIIKVTSDVADNDTEIVPWSARVIHRRGSQSDLLW